MIDLDDAYYKREPSLQKGWDKIWTRGYVDGLPEVRAEYKENIRLSELMSFYARIPGFVQEPLLIGKTMPSHLVEQMSRKALKHRRFDGVIRSFLRAEVLQSDEEVEPEQIAIVVEVEGIMEGVPSQRPYCDEDGPVNNSAFAMHDKMFLLEAVKAWLGSRVELQPAECEMQASGCVVPIEFLRYVCVDPPGLENLWRDYVHPKRVPSDDDYLYDDRDYEADPPYFEKEEPLYECDDDGETIIE